MFITSNIASCDCIAHLNDMVSEINFLPFFPCPVFYIEYANEIGGPAPKQPIEELKEDPGEHPQLGKWIRQSE